LPQAQMYTNGKWILLLCSIPPAPHSPKSGYLTYYLDCV
jgi:hypothetical protein